MSEAKVTIIPQEDRTITLQLSGNWTLKSGIPEADELLAHLANESVRQLRFTNQEIGDWDSGLLTWLLSLSDYCSAHEIDLDKSALPDGARRLLALAYTVPESDHTGNNKPRPSFVEKIGEDVIAAANITGEFIEFFGESLLAFTKMFRGKAVYRRSDLWLVFQNAGVRALPIVTLVSFLVGMIMGFVGAVQLEHFGAGIFIADLVGIAMTREMAAIMTGIIMAGRTGAAYAAEIGSMTVNEEVDALETAGFNTMEFLVLPRLLALVIMMPLLTVYADLMGIVGGAVVAVSILNLTLVEYYNQLIQAVSLADFFAGIVMAIVFGAIVAVVGCLRGIKCGRSSEAVGRATTSAVVSSIVMIVVACAVMTVMFNALGI